MKHQRFSPEYILLLEEIDRGRVFYHLLRQLQTLSQDVLLDVSTRSQYLVAKDLKINPVKMSAIVGMLKEMDVPIVSPSSPHA